MDEGQKPEPKIGEALIILGFFAFILLDIVSLIPGVGDLADVPFAISFIITFIFGDFGAVIMGTFVAVGILKAIPIAQELPWFTIGWIITIWVDRHPKSKLAKIEKAAIAMESGKGVPGAGAAGELSAAEKVEGAEKAAAGEAKAGARPSAEGGTGKAGEEGARATREEAEKAETEQFGVESLGEVKEMGEVGRTMEEVPESIPSEKGGEEAVPRAARPQKEISEEFPRAGQGKRGGGAGDGERRPGETPVLREYTEEERTQEEMSELFENPSEVNVEERGTQSGREEIPTETGTRAGAEGFGQEKLATEEVPGPTKQISPGPSRNVPAGKNEGENEEGNEGQGERGEAEEAGRAAALRTYTAEEQAKEKEEELFKNSNVVDLRSGKNDTINRDGQDTQKKAA